MITKKDFKAIAKIIWNYAAIENYNDAIERITSLNIAGELANYFATQDSRFNRQKFLNACGLQTESED